jgi:uncharacterized protein with HEPN domain
MQRSSRTYLFDIQTACGRLRRFIEGKHFEDYRGDDFLRSAVERQFEIIGEAIVQLSRIDPGVTEKISERSKIVAFRNILVHGYAVIDNAVVWDIIETKLPMLASEVDKLLRTPE